MNLDTREKELKKLKPMIRHLANKYFAGFTGLSYVPGRALEDLIQEGNLGALDAYNKYSPKKATKYSTFAYFFILGRIQLYVAANMGVCRQVHTKMGNQYSSAELDEATREGKALDWDLGRDLKLEEVDRDYDLGLLFEDLFELEKDALKVSYQVSTVSKYPRAQPLAALFVDCGIRKLRRNKP